jgi:hypothetical protein
MSGKVSLLVIALLLVSCILSNMRVTFAKTWTPGVSKGDFCYYQTYGVYRSTRPRIRFEIPGFEQNNTKWVRVNVTGISGSVVHQIYTIHFIDDSEAEFEKDTDMNPEFRDSLRFSQKGIPLCASDLEPGDPFPTANLSVKDILILSWRGTEREAVHLSWDYAEDRGDCYLDRKTGILIELYRVHTFTNLNTGETIMKTDVVKLTRTSLWTSSKVEPGQLLPQGILTASIAVLSVHMYRQNEGTKETEIGRIVSGAS